MAKFRKKPVVIEAVQITADKSFDAMQEFCPSLIQTGSRIHFLIPTMEGEMMATSGDWIIKGVAGEFYPCKPDIFAQTYEAV